MIARGREDWAYPDTVECPLIRNGLAANGAAGAPNPVKRDCADNDGVGKNYESRWPELEGREHAAALGDAAGHAEVVLEVNRHERVIGATEVIEVTVAMIMIRAINDHCIASRGDGGIDIIPCISPALLAEDIVGLTIP